MDGYSQRRHTVQLSLPLVLLLLFALTAVTVVLLSARLYRETAAEGARSDDASTACFYLSEKLRAYDSRGAVTVGEPDGYPALILRREAGEQAYLTYIYVFDGALRELLVREDASFSPADGTPVLAVESLEIDTPAPGLLRLTVRDGEGRERQTCVALRAREGEVRP